MKEKYIEILNNQIAKLKTDKDFDFQIWQYETINILSEIFGKNSSQEEQIKEIKYNWGGIGVGDKFHSWDNLESCVSKSRQLLQSFIQHLNTFSKSESKSIVSNSQHIIHGDTIDNDKRIALVIGNSNYQHTTKLTNPINDANSIEDVLSKLNFKVIKYHDLNWQEMKKAIDDFSGLLDEYDVGLFFYAGHGLQINGRNFLVPIDFKLITESRVEYECVDAQWALSIMEENNTLINIIILDACRDNPFEIKGKRAVQVGRGLASMEAPSGSIIAYSTAPGNTADDGEGNNGLYTEALLKYLPIENIQIEQAFKLTRKEVMVASSNEQIPWESTSLTSDFYMNKK